MGVGRTAAVRLYSAAGHLYKSGGFFGAPQLASVFGPLRLPRQGRIPDVKKPVPDPPAAPQQHQGPPGPQSRRTAHALLNAPGSPALRQPPGLPARHHHRRQPGKAAVSGQFPGHLYRPPQRERAATGGLRQAPGKRAVRIPANSLRNSANSSGKPSVTSMTPPPFPHHPSLALTSPRLWRQRRNYIPQRRFVLLYKVSFRARFALHPTNIVDFKEKFRFAGPLDAQGFGHCGVRGAGLVD